MSTPSRTEINQANGQHSTGPKTSKGKKKSSQNALSHGLTAKRIVMPSEDLKAYQRHLKSFTDQCDPQGAIESNLVQALADTSWRQNRIAALEAHILDQVQDPMDLVKALATLSLHSHRLSRQFEKAMTELRQLQKARQTQEKNDLDDFLDVSEMYESRDETYDPSEDGFVFSKTQINRAILSRNRERVVDEAHDIAA
jgi:hypothetical protein